MFKKAYRKAAGQNRVPSQILRRIGFVLLVLAGLFFTAVYWIRAVEESVMAKVLGSETIEHGVLFDRLLEQSGRPLEMFVESYGRRSSLTRITDIKNTTDPTEVLAAGAKTFRIDCVWVLNADDSVRIHVASQNAKDKSPPPLPPVGERADRLRYYYFREGEPYRLIGRRLAADGRSPEAPRGWLLAATRMSTSSVNMPEMPIDGRVAVMAADTPLVTPSGGFVQIDRPLLGFDKKAVAILRLYYVPDELFVLGAGLRSRTFIMAGFGCAGLALVAFLLWRWIVRPAAIMNSSLVSRDVMHLEPLLSEGGGLGRLAGLVRELISSRSDLQRALAARANLDRDLHDGVIQTIYSSGMGLTHARALVRTDPNAAEQQLDRVHVGLVAAIREVRALLMGAGSTSTSRRSFGEVGAAILDQARVTNPQLRVAVNVDESLAARLSLSQRVQLLQFTRECVSNAARHAGASVLRLDFRDTGDGPCLEISDDGSGFEPETVKQGRGLQNLAQRAHSLDAALVFDSARGRGTIVRLTLSNNNYDQVD